MSQIINNITNEESPRPLERKLTVTQYQRICAANVPLTRVASTLQYVDGNESERDIIINNTITAYQNERTQEKKEAKRFAIGMGRKSLKTMGNALKKGVSFVKGLFKKKAAESAMFRLFLI